MMAARSEFNVQTACRTVPGILSAASPISSCISDDLDSCP
jgi:hypothetical protein